jgi:hypothetical protein
MANTSNMPRSLTLPKSATAEEITCAQAVVGTLLYNAHAVDPTLLVPLSACLTIIHRHNNNTHSCLTST